MTNIQLPPGATISRVALPPRRAIDIVARDLKSGLLPWQIAQKHGVPLHRIYFFERLAKEQKARRPHAQRR